MTDINHDTIQDENVVPFVMVQNFMIDHAELFFDDAIEAFIYIYLKRRAGSQNNAFPSVKTIAKDCLCSTATVNRKIANLVKSGLVRKINQTNEDGGKGANIYRLSKVKIKVEDMGDGSQRYIPMYQSDSGAYIRVIDKEETIIKKKPIKNINNVASDDSHGKIKKERSKSKAETVIAKMQQVSKRGNESWVIQFISEQEKYLSMELLEHLAKLIIENPSKTQPYFRAIVYENWYKIKPIPQTVEELTQRSSRPSRKESTDSFEEINRKLFS